MSKEDKPTRKTIGYTELEWICPFCQSRNTGKEQKCIHCGAAQPPDIQFVQPAEEKLLDPPQLKEEQLKKPDIHCPSCQTRNPATATHCQQCGSALQGGVAREKGKVLGAHRDKKAPPIICPQCGSENRGTARQCANCFTSLPQPKMAKPTAKPTAPKEKKGRSLMGVWIVLGLIGAIFLFFFLFFRTNEVIGTVSTVGWSRTVTVMGLRPVERDDWRDELPNDAEIGRCVEKPRTTQDQPDPLRRSVEQCGTPYTLDQGNGLGEVVQDCHYQIYDDYCSYTVLDWTKIDVITTSGDDYQPFWPTDLNLKRDEREGEKEERYEIQFSADGETYDYVTDDVTIYLQTQDHADWVLDVNSFGNIRSIEPAP